MTNVVPIRAFGGAARRELIARTIIMNCACERFFAQPASSDSSTRPSQQMPLDPLVPLKNAKFRTNTNRGACHWTPCHALSHAVRILSAMRQTVLWPSAHFGSQNCMIAPPLRGLSTDSVGGIGADGKIYEINIRAQLGVK